MFRPIHPYAVVRFDTSNYQPNAGYNAFTGQDARPTYGLAVFENQQQCKNATASYMLYSAPNGVVRVSNNTEFTDPVLWNGNWPTAFLIESNCTESPAYAVKSEGQVPLEFGVIALAVALVVATTVAVWKVGVKVPKLWRRGR